MREIDSDALTLIQRQLGMSGVGDPSTMLLDGELTQVLDVGAAVRRARADIATTGWWFGVLQNVHSAADGEVSNINPFDADGFEHNTFPGTVDPTKFDIYLAGAAVRRMSGTGTIDATATFLTLSRAEAFGKDDAGAQVAAAAIAMPIAHWDGVVDTLNGVYGLNVASGEVFQRIGLRVPPQGFIQFESSSTALSTWQMYVLLGLFPVGLGQDVQG